MRRSDWDNGRFLGTRDETQAAPWPDRIVERCSSGSTETRRPSALVEVPQSRSAQNGTEISRDPLI